MLDSRVCSLSVAPNGMSILGELPMLERLDRGVGFGMGMGPPSGFRPLPPRLWCPNVWRNPPPHCPLPPLPTLPLCREPCHQPSLVGVGVTHLFDYMASARLWYPWYLKGDSMLGSSCPGLDSYDLATGKDLPSRALKADRLKERHDLTQILHIDKDHAASISARKTVVTASTQTQLSSFNGESPHYPGPPPAYFAPRGEPPSGDTYSPVHPLYGPPPSLPPVPHTSAPSSSPPASSHLVDLSHAHAGSDIQNAPLNLSLSNSPVPVSSSHGSAWQSHRPSVITCMSSSSSPMSSGGSSPCTLNGHANNNGHASYNDDKSPESDPAIEEHFRRSLGKNYVETIPKTTTASPTAMQTNLSVTGSVDDHFAKALGDSTWKAIKCRNDPPVEGFTNSVDDHFAKALGATTWRRIKAETEHSDNSSAGNSTTNTTNGCNNNNTQSPKSSSPPSSLSSSPPHTNSAASAHVIT